MKKLIFFASLMILTACAGTAVQPAATMYDPVTKVTKVCRVDKRSWGWDDDAVIARCMRDYERAGYVQVPDKK